MLTNLFRFWPHQVQMKGAGSACFRPLGMAWLGLVVVSVALVLFLGGVCDGRLGGEEQAADAGRVLEAGPDDLGWVDHS